MSNFSGTEFGNKAKGFDAPTQLPRDEAEQKAWQAANRAWWEETPMRYDWREDIAIEPGTERYFTEVDARFLASVRKFLPWRKLPFEQLVPFDSLADKDVLEIGVGQGTHAQLIAPHAKCWTGIDLTTAASQMTGKRLALFNVPGRVLQMDAEAMEFPDASFDYIWSWGVIHHSANTRQILQEMNRVLRPGGRATVMVYHRSWWHFHFGAVLRGVFQKKFRSGGLHEIAQGATDGAIARYYTPPEWREVTKDLFDVEKVRIYGLKIEVLPMPHGRLKDTLERLIPNAVGRLLTNHFRLGTFLVAEMRKA
jgi:ubiquinone/menaquinone biosynthesis C-methylase UbiE